MIYLTFEVWISFGLISLVVLYLLGQRRPHPNYPPGPWGYPILGHLPYLRKNPLKKLMEWKGVYGPLVGLKYGSYPVIVINDYKMIKEAMSETRFSGRPRLRPVCERSGGIPKGIAFTDGHEWMEKRRFTLKNLRDFGFGKKSAEAIIKDEILELLGHFRKDLDAPISTISKFNPAILNTLWTIISGDKFAQDDPQLIEILQLVNSAFPAANSPATLSILIPTLSYLFPNLLGFNPMMGQVQKIVSFVKDFIQTHKGTRIPFQPRGFLDKYLDEIDQATPGSGFYGEDGEHTLTYVLVDLFSAGAETTSTTLTNICLYMALNQECQRIMQEEIDRVCGGGSRTPSLQDRGALPYTEAVIHEVLRLCPLITSMHRATEDIQFHGYYIPKDTIVIPDIYAAHYDPEAWEEPEAFRPERFLSHDLRSVVKKEAFMPFLVGKRICPAEALARDELFLFTASMFQEFQVQVESGAPRPSTELIIKTVISPRPHKIVFSARKKQGQP